MNSKAQVKEKIGHMQWSNFTFALNVTLDLSSERRRISVKFE